MDDPRYAKLAQLFQRGWNAPGPGAWDDLLTEDIELVQPLVPTTRGRKAWDAQINDILELVPDLYGTVQNWSGHRNTMAWRAGLGRSVLKAPSAVLDKSGVRDKSSV